jgi:hypothetical protein
VEDGEFSAGVAVCSVLTHSQGRTSRRSSSKLTVFGRKSRYCPSRVLSRGRQCQIRAPRVWLSRSMSYPVCRCLAISVRSRTFEEKSVKTVPMGGRATRRRSADIKNCRRSGPPAGQLAYCKPKYGSVHDARIFLADAPLSRCTPVIRVEAHRPNPQAPSPRPFLAAARTPCQRRPLISVVGPIGTGRVRSRGSAPATARSPRWTCPFSARRRRPDPPRVGQP